MVGGVLSVTVKVAVQVDSLLAASLTCSVRVVTPSPTEVPATGSCVTTTGPLQSLATTPALKSGTSAWQVASAKALWLGAQLVIVGGVLSVTVKVAVQVDSLLAASLTCRVMVVTSSPREVPAVGVWVTTTGPLQSLATTPAVKSGTNAWQVASATAL